MFIFFFRSAILLTAVAAQATALGIAAVVFPILTHLIKGKATGMAALLIAVAVSAAIAVAATYMAGDLHNLGDLAKNAGSIFALGTILYKSVAAIGDATAPLPPSRGL